VNRDVAAANHDHFFTNFKAVAQVHVEKKIDAFDHAVEFVAGEIQVAAAVQTEGHENSLITLAAQIFQGEVAAQAHVEFQLGPEIQDFADLRLQDVARQAIFRDAQMHHASRHCRCFKNRHGI